jgi:hypothetical protein
MTGGNDTGTDAPDVDPGAASTDGSWTMRWARVVLRVVDQKLRRRPSKKVERILLLIAFVAFVVMGILAATNFPDVGTGVEWGVLIPVGLIGMALNMFFNALEFDATARFVGHPIPYGRAMRITVLGSAANLLPLPGGVMIRTQALAARGARYRHTLTTTAVIGIMSIASQLLVVPLANIADASAGVLLALFGSGVVAVLVGFGVLRTAGNTSRSTRYGAYMLAIEVGYASVAAVRLWLIFVGLGIDVSLPAAFAMSGVGSVATAIGFFPAALGIKEALVGLVSPLVGVPVAVGVTGAVVQRLFGFAVLAMASGTLVLLDARRGRPPDPELAEEVAEFRAEIG